MPNYTINVAYNPVTKIFSYTDELNNPGDPKFVEPTKTIQWLLAGGSGGAHLVIVFADSQVFNFSPAPPRTTVADNFPCTLGSPHTREFKYEVILIDNSGALIDSDDPEIIFGDPPPVESLSAALLGKLGPAAGDIFCKAIEDMKATAAVTRDPNALFFPGGITNINVQVTAAGVTANITVSGPTPPSAPALEE